MLLDPTGEPLEDVVVLDRHDAADFNEPNILPQPEVVVASIRSWLSPTDYADEGSEYDKHLSSHLKGTGQWATETPAFRGWHGGQAHGMLWVRGIPGAGKSVLAATLIEYLSRQGYPVLYFFFRHTIQANHRPEAALRDWLSQVLDFSPPLQLELKEKITTPVDSLTVTDLSLLLRKALAYLPKAYCVVDALDEMHQAALEPFLQILDELGHWRPGEIKLIITSRPIAMVERIVRNLKLLDVRLDGQLVQPDITVYLRHRLGQSLIPSDSHSVLIEVINDKADGLFLYAKLAVDAISHMRDPAEVQQVLGGLPMDLAVMYTELLQEHLKRTGISPELQILVLQLVTQAVRPLRLLEIADAIAVTRPEYGCDLGKLKNLVRSACGPLLEILPNETMRVVHHSLTEYLLGTNRTPESTEAFPILDPGSANSQIALVCISYVQSGCLDQVEAYKNHSLPNSVLSYRPKQIFTPFTNYAVQNWHVHVKRAEISQHNLKKINNALHQLLVSGDAANTDKVGSFVKLTTMRTATSGKEPDPRVAALRLAIALGLTAFAESLLRAGEEITKYNSDVNFSPLNLAARRESAEMIRLLIRYGADPDEYDSHGVTPLHAAIGCGTDGRESPINAGILLQAGADAMKGLGDVRRMHMRNYGPDGPAKEPQIPPAMFVFHRGGARMADVFLPYIKGTEAAHRVLRWVVDGGRNPNTVAKILQHPETDINAKYGGVTLLYLACAAHDSVLVRLLLKAGADPNIPLEHELYVNPAVNGIKVLSCNALHALMERHGWSRLPGSRHKTSQEETQECFRLLIAAGANVHKVDDSNTTLLHVAVDSVSTRCLVEAGLDVNARNKMGETPLHLTYDMEVIEILLSGFDMNAISPKDGRTLLVHTLADADPLNFLDLNGKRIKKALKLCDMGTDVTVVDIEGNSALHYAARITGIGEPDGLQLLVKLMEGGADANLRNKKGETALHVFEAVKEDSLVAFLEILKPDMNVKDDRGRTPLFHIVGSWNRCSEEEAMAICRLMVKHNARFDIADDHGRSLLHAVPPQCLSNSQCLEFLVDHGADPKKRDSAGNTAFHEVIPRFGSSGVPPEVFRGLSAAGLDASQANQLGRTPLHILCGFKYWTHETDHPSALDYILSKDPAMINQKDNNGVTPLHIASTFSEFLTRCLLEKGSDPVLTTNEGLTTFHLAARSRQANVVGILLDWLRSRTDQQTLVKVLNSKDSQGRSPIYYACASGRVETVQLLLDGGASADSNTYTGSAWNGCADFEVEQRTADWSRWDTNNPRPPKEPQAGGVLISDKTRPRKLLVFPEIYLRRCPFPEERIDDILDLLVTRAAGSGTRFLDEAIVSAAERKLDYTVVCLTRARDSLGLTTVLDHESQILECCTRRYAFANSIDAKQFGIKGFMGSRCYQAVRTSIQDSNGADLDTNFLEELVHGGFASLLDSILTPEIVQKLSDNASSTPILSSLLGTACNAESPNLEVMRVLIEKKRVSVCTPMARKLVWDYQSATALHILVYNGCPHWWQRRQALPYLLEKGAKTETRVDRRGLTPLLICLTNTRKSESSRETVAALLEAGADPNAVDNEGCSCLGAAADDRPMIELLLKHGAVVTHSALNGAVKGRDVELLQLLLSRGGVDPNTRRAPKASEEITQPNPWSKGPVKQKRHNPEESKDLYPLDYVVCKAGIGDHFTVGMRMFEVLLDHGADLCATYERTTIMHRMLMNMGSSMSTRHLCENPFLPRALDHPGLNVEACDADGLTLLLLACKLGKLQVIDKLLDRGANIRARDGNNRNALHLLCGAPPFVGEEGNKCISRILQLAPELLHELDNQIGFTPLHYALRSVWNLKEKFDPLLSAGADVSLVVQESGSTPLHILLGGVWGMRPDPTGTKTFTGHRIELLDRLCSLRADINARDGAGETPVFHYFRTGSIVVALPSNDPPASPDTPEETVEEMWSQRRSEGIAAREAEPKLWQLLDEAGVDWLATNESGQSLLHVVAADVTREYDSFHHYPGRRVARFRFLISKGLDALAEDNEHRTALDIAAALGVQDILDIFKTKD